MAYSNGQFPKSATVALATAPGQRLEPTAARQWDALARSVQNAYGWLPALTDSYRPYTVQEAIFRDRYRSGNRRGQPGFTSDVRYWPGHGYWTRRSGTAAAAVPGTSNHGWAKAVDCSGLGGFSGTRFKQLAALAPRFGFTNTEGRSVGEAWHWVFTGAYTVTNPIGGTGTVTTPTIPGAPAPITPEDDMAQVPQDQWANLYLLVQNIAAWVYKGGPGVSAGDAAGGTISQRTINLDRQMTGAQGNAVNVADAVGVLLARTADVARKGGAVSLRQEIADAKTNTIALLARDAAQTELIRQLSAGTATGTPAQVDYDRIDASVRAAVADVGAEVKSAIEAGIAVDINVTGPGTPSKENQ